MSAIEPFDGAWTMEQLLAAEASGQRLKFLAFWGHTPPPHGGIGPHVLSQWYESPFVCDGVAYRTAEHYMMAEKARLFQDDQNLAAIMAAVTPDEAKSLGRLVRGFLPDRWNAECVAIVRRGSVAKFGATPEMRAYLVGTGSHVLVEASPQDRIWGVGMGKNDPLVESPSGWRGRNLLGFALMQARAILAGR